MTGISKQGGVYVDGKLIGHVVSGGRVVSDIDGKVIGVVATASAVFDIEVGGMPDFMECSQDFFNRLVEHPATSVPEGHVTQAAMDTLQQTAPDLAARCAVLAGNYRQAVIALGPAYEAAREELTRLGVAMGVIDSRPLNVRFLHVIGSTRLPDLEPSDADLSGHALARLEKKRRQAEAKTARQEQIRRRGGKR